jgi:hypothetical protein
MNSNNMHKRFGAIAVQKQFITTEQLLEALKLQAEENVGKGQHRLIGQILFELGYITETQIEEVLEVINDRMVYMLSVGR